MGWTVDFTDARTHLRITSRSYETEAGAWREAFDRLHNFDKVHAIRGPNGEVIEKDEIARRFANRSDD